MPGFEGDPAPPANVTAMARTRDEGVQAGYVPPPPGKAQPGYIKPPALEQFANATYLPAGPEIRKIVERVLKFKELADLRGIEIDVVWRRKGKPMLGLEEDERRFVAPQIFDPLVHWLAKDREATFPALVLNLYWLHFEELSEAEEGPTYVAEKNLERHIFMALRVLDVSESGVLSIGSMTFDHIADLVSHYGKATVGLVRLAEQLALWPSAGEG